MSKKKSYSNSGYKNAYYDNYYDNYSYPKTTYKSWGSWDWGGYGAVIEEDDDLFIKSHESYLTPTSSVISAKVERSYDTFNNRKLVKELARFFYYRMVGEKGYISEKYLKDPETLSPEDQKELSEKTGMYNELWEKFIPGYTPLDQALAVFYKLQSKDRKGKGDIQLDRMEESMIEMAFHEKMYNDANVNELLEMQELAKTNKMNIFKKISMIQELGGKFKIEKEITEKLAANSRLISKKVMRDYSQLHLVDSYQRVMPTFKAKLLTKDLIVNVPIEKTEHKQKIIILLDYSGSMCSQEKQLWVLSILIDRLQYVMKEEAEIYFSYFLHETKFLHFTHIYDRASALEFWSKFSTRPNGGDTRLGVMIEAIDKSIKEDKKLINLDVDLSEEMPEVLAINDGQDSVKTNAFVYKTNAITLVDHENDELKRLCLKNKGKYVFVKTENDIVTYE